MVRGTGKLSLALCSYDFTDFGSLVQESLSRNAVAVVISGIHKSQCATFGPHVCVSSKNMTVDADGTAIGEGTIYNRR